MDAIGDDEAGQREARFAVPGHNDLAIEIFGNRYRTIHGHDVPVIYEGVHGCSLHSQAIRFGRMFAPERGRSDHPLSWGIFKICFRAAWFSERAGVNIKKGDGDNLEFGGPF